MKYIFPVGIILVLLGMGCGKVTDHHQLPILGNTIYEESDTIYHTIGNFSLVNQDSAVVTPATYSGQITISDFFFTTCPTICPKMKAQMLRVYETIKDDKDVTLVSYTIDPQHDSVAVLNRFAQNLGVKSSHWQFLTGEKDSIYALAETYLVMADEDPGAPGGFVHSGAFLLVDKERRVRGFYDGTMPDQVDLLINDIDLLRKEYE